MAMCRAQFVDRELDRVLRDIAKRPPSTTDVEDVLATVADHWAELTMVHPFRDGNSRTQRYFFDQLLRNAGWALDWTRINSEQVHAARYVGAATVDASYLAQALWPGMTTEQSEGTLSDTEGLRDDRVATEIFHDMMDFRRSHPRGTEYRAR